MCIFRLFDVIYRSLDMLKEMFCQPAIRTFFHVPIPRRRMRKIVLSALQTSNLRKCCGMRGSLDWGSRLVRSQPRQTSPKSRRSLTNKKAAPKGGSFWSLTSRREILLRFLTRFGGVLLSHALRRSTIGATVLNCRVRDGIGCFTCAMTTKPRKKPNISQHIFARGLLVCSLPNLRINFVFVV